MRVAVIGATGPVGAAVVDALRLDPNKRVDAIIGIAKRLPARPEADVQWQVADPSTSDLQPFLRGVDALVDAATRTRATAPQGGRLDDVGVARRVLETAVGANVLNLVQLSSFLAYAPPGPGGEPVEESWPTDGLTASGAPRSAAALEHLLDEFAAEHEVARLVRIRCGVVIGPRVRQEILARTGPVAAVLRLVEHLPVVPGLDSAGLPVVHHEDLAAAVTAAVTGSAFGAYNVALEEPLRLADVASALGARPVCVRPDLARRAAALVDRVLERLPGRADRSASDWLDVLTHAPRLDTRRAREELGWEPRHRLDEALRSTLAAD